MFDYPTVADLTDFIVAQFSEGEDDAEGVLGGAPVGGGTMVEATEGWNLMEVLGTGKYFKS